MIKSISNAEHYKWGGDCDGWHLLKSDSLSVIQERMPAGASEQMHFHRHAQQLFYILSGWATFEIESDTIIIHAGEFIHVRPRVKHRIRNESADDITFIVISEPKSHGDREIRNKE